MAEEILDHIVCAITLVEDFLLRDQYVKILPVWCLGVSSCNTVHESECIDAICEQHGP